jgi:hypothetical protein
MGVWDQTAFGNDDACDWAGGLQGYQDLSFIEKTLDKVIDVGDGYLEAYDSSLAIAAAEAVAKLQGRAGISNAYTEPVDAWVKSHPQIVTVGLVEKSHEALDRILKQPSELLELWEESDLFEAWKKSVVELKTRIDIED